MVDTTSAERAKLRRLRGAEAGVVEPPHSPPPPPPALERDPDDELALVVRRPPPAATAPPPPARAQANQRPNPAWLANGADHEWKQYCGLDGVIPGGIGWGGMNWENNR